MQNRLDAYVARLDRHLARLPVWRREEELREIRQHLAALVMAYQELGSSEGEAVSLALAQFGPPAQNARDLRRAWRRQQERVEVGPSVRRAFAWFGPLAVLSMAGTLLSGRSEPAGLATLLTGLAGVLSLFAGWRIGRDAPGQGYVKAIAAVSAVLLVHWASILVVLLLACAPLVCGVSLPPLTETIPSDQFALFGAGCALGGLSAIAASIMPEWGRVPPTP
jgi:uncharacterized membrane protein